MDEQERQKIHETVARLIVSEKTDKRQWRPRRDAPLSGGSVFWVARRK
jgi:hypothetical protein